MFVLLGGVTIMSQMLYYCREGLRVAIYFEVVHIHTHYIYTKITVLANRCEDDIALTLTGAADAGSCSSELP